MRKPIDAIEIDKATRKLPMLTTGTKTPQPKFPFEPDYATEPGLILQETIEGLGITAKDLAARTGYTLKYIDQLINGRSRISRASAIRLERVTQIPSRFWINLETHYQDLKARLLILESTGDHRRAKNRRSL